MSNASVSDSLKVKLNSDSFPPCFILQYRCTDYLGLAAEFQNTKKVSLQKLKKLNLTILSTPQGQDFTIPKHLNKENVPKNKTKNLPDKINVTLCSFFSYSPLLHKPFMRVQGCQTFFRKYMEIIKMQPQHIKNNWRHKYC